MCRAAGVSGAWLEVRICMHVESESIGECGLSP